MVRFFYPADAKAMADEPADAKAGQHYSYLGSKMPILQQIFANLHHIPLWASALLWRNIMTHAYSNAPLATARSTYPVILFSHGGLGLPSDTYAAIIEELASHGYIVVAMDHPYLNLITQYPDERVVSSQEISAQFNRMRPKDQYEFLTGMIEVYKADMKLVLDELAKINADPNSIFYHHLDLDHIGVMGHSAGGTASIEFCRSDSRCKAAADLDGWYDHIIGHEPLKQPLLLMFAEKSLEIGEPTPEYLKRKELTREGYFEREKNIAEHRKALCNTSNCAMIILPNADHGSFGDAVLFKWPFRSWHDPDSYALLSTINKHIVNFFDKYLASHG